MKLPPDLQREFEIHLQQPPVKTRTVRKQLALVVNAVNAEDVRNAPLFSECEQALEGMLSIIQRKTTPLYVRLIHSAVSYFNASIQEEGSETLEKAATVIDSVAVTIGREAYRIQRP